MERTGCTFQAFAPNKDQVHTVDHTKGEASTIPPRNVMVESARIVRGNIQPADAFNCNEYDALVIPGGFGAMKNLCNYALDDTTVHTYDLDVDVRKMIEDCLSSKTPLALSCIAPMLLPKVQTQSVKIDDDNQDGGGETATTGNDSDSNGDSSFEGTIHMNKKITLTLGKSEGDDFPYAGTIGDAKALGIHHVECDNKNVVIDEDHLIVTAPAFMQDAGYYAVFQNIGQMVDALVKLMEK